MLADRYRCLAAGLGELDGVGEQVAQHRLHHYRVAVHRRGGRRVHHADRQHQRQVQPGRRVPQAHPRRNFKGRGLGVEDREERAVNQQEAGRAHHALGRHGKSHSLQAEAGAGGCEVGKSHAALLSPEVSG